MKKLIVILSLSASVFSVSINFTQSNSSEIPSKIKNYQDCYDWCDKENKEYGQGAIQYHNITRLGTSDMNEDRKTECLQNCSDKFNTKKSKSSKKNTQVKSS